MADMYAPGEDFDLFITVSPDPRDPGATLAVPADHMEAVIDALRSMAIDVADEHLNAGARQWTQLDKRAPGLIEDRKFSELGDDFARGQEALRFLALLAPVIDDDDDDHHGDPSPVPDPDPSATAGS